MKNSSLFVRGQVWYWDDPIYGRKENNLDVSVGEATIRYSRYCIIAQTTNTIDKSSVLVIPCSSSNHTQHDVPTPLAHIFHENFTYARTRGIFPVHPKFLQRYICTLPEIVMKQMEAEFIKLLIPSIMDGMDNQEILDRFGFNMDGVIPDIMIKKYSHTLEINLIEFIKNYLVKTDSNDSITAYELKNAFSQFCSINKLEIVDDVVELVDMFSKLTGNVGCHLLGKPRYNLIEFRGLRIKDDFQTLMNDMMNPDDLQKSGKWDNDSIEEFLKVYDSDGVDVASNKFGLKQSTSTNYWYKWKDRLVLDKPSIVIPRIPTTIDAPKSISKITNMIRDNLKEMEIRNNIIASDPTVSIEVSESIFYNIIGTCIYYSLLEFMSIRKDNDNFFCPNLNENSNYLSTWHFFDKAYHDKRISLNKTGASIIESYKKHFPQYKGIDSSWLSKLKSRLIGRLGVSDADVNEICNIIQKQYCDL